MVLEFTKMNGAGNDFVLIDNRSGSVRLTPDQVVRLCHRQRGVGADGLLMLIPCRSGRADWAWEFYNSDGSVADMCGNGARCFARFIQRVVGAKDRFSFETGAGVITATFQGERVTVSLTPPKDQRLEESVVISAGKVAVHSLNTGVPHAVVYVPDADKAMVGQWGAELRHHDHFKPRGANVNFVQVLRPGRIRVRTYERGVEGETLACGTGVTASALLTHRLHQFPSPIQVQVQGGDELEVSFRKENDQFTDVTLSGPAVFVFQGRIEI
ncbi:MAG: diaminopimelate epimerase [Verrucomicrobia bacterium]|nr:diaminopimelate epimerase [Verrucomicrobiota bacterium]MBI3868019.1 diaminopimelate epimerase [Verrucomicrobiota bacterium]